MTMNSPMSGDDARMAELLNLAAADVTPRERRPADAILARADRWRWLHGLRGVFVALLTVSLAGGGAAVAASQLRGGEVVVSVTPAPSESSKRGDVAPLALPACPYELHVTPTDAPVTGVVPRGEPIPAALLPSAADFGPTWVTHAGVVDDLPLHPDVFDRPSPPEAAAQERGRELTFSQEREEPSWRAHVSLMRYEPAAARRAFQTFADAELGCGEPGFPLRAIAQERDFVIAEAPPSCGPCSPELSDGPDTSAEIHAVAIVGDLVGFASFSMQEGRYAQADLDELAKEMTTVVVARMRGDAPPPLPATTSLKPTPATGLLQADEVPEFFHVGGAPGDAASPPPLTIKPEGCAKPVVAQQRASVAQIYRADVHGNGLWTWQETVYTVGADAADSFIRAVATCKGVRPLAGMSSGLAYFETEHSDNSTAFPGIVVQVGDKLLRLQILQDYESLNDGKGAIGHTRPLRADLPGWMRQVATDAVARLRATS